MTLYSGASSFASRYAKSGRKSDTNFAIAQKAVSMIIKKQRFNITIVEKLIVTALLTQISWANHFAIMSNAKISVKFAKHCLANLKIFRLWELEESFV